MGLIDSLKTSAERATAASRESIRETQLTGELARAYEELGRETFACLEQGTLAAPGLAAPVQRVRELQRQLADLAHHAPGPDNPNAIEHR